jgi:hypothetical protein
MGAKEMTEEFQLVDDTKQQVIDVRELICCEIVS